MDNETNSVSQKVKRELADFLGVDMEDIEDETEFATDLHMDAVALTDFMDILDKAGLEIDKVDLAEVESFSDLIDALTIHV
jgi:acyl carrier protein